MPRIRFPRIGKFLESGESRKMGKNQVNLGKWVMITGLTLLAFIFEDKAITFREATCLCNETK